MPETESIVEAPTRRGRPKKPPNPGETVYILKGIPKPLWLRAKGKAAENEMSMRSVLIQLLGAWVES